jgi:chromosome segregation ATPase
MATCTAQPGLAKQTTMDDSQVTQELSKVNINGQEYDPTEAQSLIDLGRQTKEAEAKYNTSLDKVWPEYGRSQSTVKQLTQELSEAKTQLTEYQSKVNSGTDTKADLTEAREAASKLDVNLKDYIKRDDLDKYLDERDTVRNQVETILKAADKLATEINGDDGRPKFNKKAVLAYAQAYGISDLKAAYEDMHEDTLKSWKDEQIARETKPGLKTLKPTGAKGEPEKTKVTDDNVKDLLKETLWGAKE